MRKEIPVLVATIFTLAPLSSFAADHPVNPEWKEQESWQQFTDKEHFGGFKTTRRTGGQPATNVDPVLKAATTTSGTTPGTAPSSTFSAPSYIVMPSAEPAPTPPAQHRETTLVPVVHPDAYMPVGGGWWAGGWRRPSYWGGYGGYGPLGLGRYGAWQAPFGMMPTGVPPVTFQKHTEWVQDGPSKASGNYYAPSTPDPTASGNYYASPTPAPKAAPVIQQDQGAVSNWGRGGSPLPQEMQP